MYGRSTIFIVESTRLNIRLYWHLVKYVVDEDYSASHTDVDYDDGRSTQVAGDISEKRNEKYLDLSAFFFIYRPLERCLLPNRG